MIRRLLLIVVAIGANFPIRADEFKVNGRTFQLPEGFSIELVAGPPQVNRPIVADFDEQGRLYVADSSGSNDPVAKQLQEKPHRIVRLEDTDGNGTYDRQTVFADKMMFPSGAMWHDGSLYVSAPPSIWKLTDTNGDGVADQRSEWFQGKTLTGCANDLHGPYLGPDGWIYWCKGAFARQTYDRPGKPPFSTRAAHIFRARPDGSAIEPVMTGGMDNPVDVVFTTGGERIFTTTFLQNPGGGHRDGLIHAIYGGVYGKIHDVIDEHPQTGPDVMPVLSHLGPAAPCGLTRYESAVFGSDFRDNLFACQFNLRKVSRHVLTPSGSTFASQDLDFLTATDLDFHPTDVLEDADGSLLVVDTGGWYKLCCPTSQIEKPDVLGAIYRIRKVGAKHLVDPRGLKLNWDGDLVARLGDARPAVRHRALNGLAKQGAKVVPELVAIAKSEPLAVFALSRIEGAEARAGVRLALESSVDTIRIAALNSISLRRDREAVPLLLKALQSENAFERRLAAESLGRIGEKSVIPGILDAAKLTMDRCLEHALIYALIELDDPAATSLGLQRSESSTRRVALIALDQMAGSRLKPDAIVADLSSSDRSTKATANWIAGRHPQWGETLAGVLDARLLSDQLSVTDRGDLEIQLARFAKSKAVQERIGLALKDPATAIRQSALKVIARSDLSVIPPDWATGLIRLLATDDPSQIAQVVSTIRAVTVKGPKSIDLAARLIEVSARTALPLALRVEALAGIPGGLSQVSPPTFLMLREALQIEQPVALRLLAADVVARAKFSNEQLIQLSDILAKAGPLELDRLLAPYEFCSDDAVGLRLMTALKGATAVSSLRAEMIKPRITKFGLAVQHQAEALYVSLDVNASQQKIKLDQLMASLPSGEIRRGQAVFNGAKAVCISCHALGYVGGNVGPDLSRIGQIRAERDLLEAIVYPSASFVRSFEPILVATKEGKSINGLLRKEASDEVVLVTGPNQETRVARNDIEEMRPGTISIMPAGLDQQLSKQELADLIAFLKSRN